MTKNTSSQVICTTRYSRIVKLGNNVVAKSVKLEGQSAPHDVETELQILQKCKHQNIIPLLSSSLSKGVVEFTMPYITSDLFQFMKCQYRTSHRAYLEPLLNLSDASESTGKLRKNKLSMSRTLGIIRQILDGLSHIHSLGIIHRDIKPQNILIDTATDHIYIIDFGISYDTTQRTHKYGESDDLKIHDVSTSIYKAPELMFSVRNYGLAADVWSLAVMISQLFQDQISTRWVIPAFVDDGAEELEAGTDIKAVMSIFQNLGIPSQEQWPQVVKYGSSGFVGMFGTEGDGNYIFDKPWPEQLARAEAMFPRLREVRNYQEFAKLLLRMVIFDTDKRITSAEALSTYNEITHAT
ncbi:HDL525Cp [Eremothecium sinecaudum]|uniref:HDL525Cp n=1 Tax=Eremothecium sinecaudum TaxID=45286 RepID=A0A0X8HRN4_9SACH|nr:HDL525Cp [Eremothecium sinecaudum]AMD20219.1 HDL525Cp [Eremothecium sinecaudum]